MIQAFWESGYIHTHFFDMYVKTSIIPIPLFPELESLKKVIAEHLSISIQRFRESFLSF